MRFKAPKTEKSRRDVALTLGAIAVLRSQNARQSKLQLHLSGPFCDERLDTFSNEFLRAVKASGLPKVNFHGLRHSYASRYAQARP